MGRALTDKGSHQSTRGAYKALWQGVEGGRFSCLKGYRLAILAPLLSLMFDTCVFSLEVGLGAFCLEGKSEVGVVGEASLSREAETRRPMGAGRVDDAVDKLTKSERRGISRDKKEKISVGLGEGKGGLTLSCPDPSLHAGRSASSTDSSRALAPRNPVIDQALIESAGFCQNRIRRERKRTWVVSCDLS